MRGCVVALCLAGAAGCSSPIMTDTKLPAATTIESLAGSSTQDLWLKVAGNGAVDFRHYDGSSWKAITPTSPPEALVNASPASIASAGSNALWVAARSRTTYLPYIGKLTLDGQLEDHTSELPRPASQGSAWQMSVNSGGGEAVVVYAEAAPDNSSFVARVFRYDGSHFVEIGTFTDYATQFLGVFGPQALFVKTENAIKQWDGTTWHDQTGLDLSAQLFGANQKSGVWALVDFNANDQGQLTAYQWSSGQWIPRTYKMPTDVRNPDNSWQFWESWGVRGLLPREQGDCAVIYVHSKVGDTSDAYTGVASGGQVDSGGTMLFHVADLCADVGQCSMNVSKPLLLPDGGFVLVLKQSSIYVGHIADI